MDQHILKTRIKQLAQEKFASVIKHRRHLHQWPELSYQEEKTADYVSNVLMEAGIPYKRGIGGHGIVALITGEKHGLKTIALRADMDALPIQEENQVDYRSKNDGVMHACGHDVHTSSLLGTALLLQELRSEFGGIIKLLFQPAEERLPGGASLMIKDGALLDPTPLAIFGQHVHPPLEAGKIGVKSGMYMASTDELYLTVMGRGGHAAVPEDLIDPVIVTANLLVALQQVVSRHADPTIPTVLSFGKINSTGGATNVIPSEVKLEGTFRTMDEAWRKKAHAIIRRICTSVAAAHGATCDLTILNGYPFLKNEPKLTERFVDYAETFLGKTNVVELPIRMTAEDFAYYSQSMDACFYRLGTGNVTRGITSPIHTPTFDVDEDCLKVGMGLMAFCAISELTS